MAEISTFELFTLVVAFPSTLVASLVPSLLVTAVNFHYVANLQIRKRVMPSLNLVLRR